MHSNSKSKSESRRRSNDRSTRKSDGYSLEELESITIHLSALESSREVKRNEYKSLSERFLQIRNQMTSLGEELHQLDDEIESVEKEKNRLTETMISSRNGNRSTYKMNSDSNRNVETEVIHSKQYAENLTQYVTRDGQKVRRPVDVPDDEFIGDTEADDEYMQPLSMHPEENFTEPTQNEFYDIPSNFERKAQCDSFGDSKPNSKSIIPTSRASDTRPSSSGGYNPLELVTTRKNVPSQKSTNGTPTLDQYFKPPENHHSSTAKPQASVAPSSSSIFPPLLADRYAKGSFVATAPQPQMATENHNLPTHQRSDGEKNRSVSSYLPSDTRRQQKRPFDSSFAHDRALGSDDYEWSKPMMECLQNTFGIQTFRDHQKEIINCTMSGHDAFVIMRTGGGKSLTYQLPALLEGRGPERKVTLVVSPLLSLIRDQEDQMNGFAPGSAISITSGMSGGTTEQARRWGLIRDPDAGVCLILVTPERVHQSNKLKGELEKLHNQGRLGRFVIDECHCACQWGHDFRPDYTQLGVLKNHFPDIPLMAVTATASDRVREDCCKILRIGSNYKLFKSSANRPNLTYIIKEKPDGKDAVISHMADFILSYHKNDAGIIYTLSKKEAEEVAQKLNNTYNISARAFHSEISDSVKESVQRGWMKNRTQVVVATIAFGLGINKADVRFVLHHTLSKSLEAYYQESGRAGRDGGPADCVLYYAPKDISRVLAMIHGQVSEATFWSMVRYGQTHGNDAVCRQIILATLGDINMIAELSTENVEVKDVTIHSRIAVQLVNWSVKDLTIQQLVTLWRGKEAPAFVEEYPPKDLSKDDCERLIVNLLVSDILSLNFVYTSYNTLVYIQLGRDAQKFLSSSNMNLTMRFPIRHLDTENKRTKAKSNGKEVSSSSSNNNSWISTKKSKKSMSLVSSSTTAKTKKRSSSSSASSKKKSLGTITSDTIHILDDSDSSSSSSDDDLSVLERKVKARRVTDEWSHADKLFESDDES